MQRADSLKPRLVLDGNIFGLQVHGGVSGYAARLFVELRRAGMQPALIQPGRSLYQGFGKKEIAAAERAYTEMIPARLAQYLPVHLEESAVFHSSYYRQPYRKVRRYVVTAHDFTYERFRSGMALQIHHRLKMAAIRAADTVICISEATRQDVLEHCPEIDPARLHVIHHGVDSAVFFPEHDADIQKVMERRVLFLGQRGGYKRFSLAVEALAIQADLGLAIVGAPLTHAEMALLEGKIPGRWSWLGRVDDTKLRQLYSAAHAFIFPSDYEGFGLPVLEALACGCPVVISQDRALREVGGAAVLQAKEQEPEAYAAELSRLCDPLLRAELQQKGFDVVERMSWERCIRLTAEALQA